MKKRWLISLVLFTVVTLACGVPVTLTATATVSPTVPAVTPTSVPTISAVPMPTVSLEYLKNYWVTPDNAWCELVIGDIVQRGLIETRRCYFIENADSQLFVEYTFWNSRTALDSFLPGAPNGTWSQGEVFNGEYFNYSYKDGTTQVLFTVTDPEIDPEKMLVVVVGSGLMNEDEIKQWSLDNILIKQAGPSL
jgi:hypothetical protein